MMSLSELFPGSSGMLLSLTRLPCPIGYTGRDDLSDVLEVMGGIPETSGLVIQVSMSPLDMICAGENPSFPSLPKVHFVFLLLRELAVS
jgi:hypothetical protein